RQSATRLEHASDFPVKACPVGDVHGHVLQQHGVEMAIGKWEIERIGGLKRYLPALSRALRQIACRFHEWLAEIHARNTAAAGGSQKASRATDARADVQNRHFGRDSGQCG